MEPMLSIVIANYNYGRFLGAAIRSVLDQNQPDVELIVVDGASTDDSVDIIKQYDGRLSWWVSERDKGQSDAFNKGFEHCRGRFLTWLNADDLMVPGSLENVVKSLKEHPECDWFAANFFRFLEDGSIYECPWGPNYLPKWLQGRGRPIAVYGPSSIFSKRLYEKMGGMKTYQHFMMDTDLWMRFVVAGVYQRRINAFVWAFRMHKASKTAEFGDHKLPPAQRVMFETERARCLFETGYKASRLNAMAYKIWRVLDLSAFKYWWLKRIFKRVENLV